MVRKAYVSSLTTSLIEEAAGQLRGTSDGSQLEMNMG